MSLERGGRSNKYGNDYENKYLAKLLLRLVRGEFKSIKVEPLGENLDSVEYVALDKEDNCLHYQCKASNDTKGKWSFSDLNRYDVFNRIKAIVKEDSRNKYAFVSPLSYGELPELCKRAGTNSSIDEFVKYQLNNPTIKKTWENCGKYFEFDESNKNQASQLMEILSKCSFVTYPYDAESIRNLNFETGVLFMGDSGKAREVLENYINSNGLFGVPIGAEQIISDMEKGKFYFRNNYFGQSNVSIIKELNDIFCKSFCPINGSIIHRTETEMVIKEISKGNSVILHGKAGYGKSGCVYEIINNLISNNIPFWH